MIECLAFAIDQRFVHSTGSLTPTPSAMPKRKEIKINAFEFRRIMGNEWAYLDQILSTILCLSCHGDEDNHLTDYEPYLNERRDVILKGKCSVCGNSVDHYLEMHENPDSAAAAESVWEIHNQGCRIVFSGFLKCPSLTGTAC